MKKLTIKTQSQYIDDKTASFIEGILATLNITFISVPMDVKVTVKDMLDGATVRCINCVYQFCEYQKVDPQHLTVSEFFGFYTYFDLLRCRNMGKKSIKELQEIAKRYGIIWGPQN